MLVELDAYHAAVPVAGLDTGRLRVVRLRLPAVDEPAGQSTRDSMARPSWPRWRLTSGKLSTSRACGAADGSPVVPSPMSLARW